MFKFKKCHVFDEQSLMVFPQRKSIFWYIFLSLAIHYAIAEVKYAGKMTLDVANVHTGTPFYNEKERQIFIETMTEILTTPPFSDKIPGFIKIDEVWHIHSRWETFYTLHYTSGPIDPPWILRSRRYFSTHYDNKISRLMKQKGSKFWPRGPNVVEPYIEGGTPIFYHRTTTYQGQIITTRAFYTPKEDKTTSPKTTYIKATEKQRGNSKTEADLKNGGKNLLVMISAIVGLVLISLVVLFTFHRRSKKQSSSYKYSSYDSTYNPKKSYYKYDYSTYGPKKNDHYYSNYNKSSSKFYSNLS